MGAPSPDQEESRRLMKWKAAKEFRGSRGGSWIHRVLEAYDWPRGE
jgi:hypothetical protein